MIPKKCKYCKHREVHEIQFEGLDRTIKLTDSFCKHEESKRIYPDGSVHWKKTDSMRSPGAACGLKAKLWEAKE